MVIDKVFAGGVNAYRLFCERLAANHFILQLDVSQLVFQLGWVRSFDYLLERLVRESLQNTRSVYRACE